MSIEKQHISKVIEICFHILAYLCKNNLHRNTNQEGDNEINIHVQTYCRNKLFCIKMGVGNMSSYLSTYFFY